MTFGINAFIAGFDPENFSRIGPDSRFLIEVDAYLSESHSFQARIPDHPVESGVTVSDHIVLLPPIVSIQGIITDTPLLRFDSSGNLIVPEEGRSIDKAKSLLELRENRSLFSVSTTLGVYRNYFFTELNIAFTPDDGYSVRFNATLKQLKLVVFRTGQKVLNQTKEVSSRSAEENDVGTVTPSSIAVRIGAAVL